MALVVLLKGVNVGGHRTFRPSLLAQELKRYDVVNVGAAGTFVVRAPVDRATLRAEIARRLPFEADIMICSGSEVARFAAGDPFAQQPAEPGIVRFVSVLARRGRPSSPLPLTLPTRGEWGVTVVARHGRFVYGLYRREMRAIALLGRIETIFDTSMTTRSWTTFSTIAGIVNATGRKHDGRSQR